MINISIFWHFFILGLFSFGGPIAHIGYFRKKFVEELKWLSDEEFSKIVALSQFLPGPSSSQVGFTIGLKKGGIFGAILAFIAFTTPSFLLLYLAATFQNTYENNSVIYALMSGLKLFAVVIVADTTFSMFKALCKTTLSKIIFIFATLFLIFNQSFLSQILVLVVSAFVALFFIKEKNTNKIKYEKPYILPLFIFFILLIFLPFISNQDKLLSLFNSFYQVGSLIFGGGHVVLPLIKSNINIDENSFLVAYSLSQAVPGPMFTIASYIGVVAFEESPFLGAVIATIAIFLPGFLLILAFYKSFESYSKNSTISKIVTGINASVVAILFSVLVTIVIPSGILNIYDLIFAILGFFVIRRFKISVLLLILFYCGYGFIRSLYV
ncbi:chromate efflux transporter [Aliarcobacter butzleri]|jgi:chromate transporter|uniref:Chromate efflux transporter n=1 Tax=Aliarcobacter butzleri TaxID=28197 RepID=A0AAP4PXU1_9BACT|nr:chromate efflux transporter [Aliarcobacter butzleri]MCG3688573.1 chromate efflux transporter [Aliarcobacter butzleri]MCG3704753.1 chromate efflux transporter [Aliarcobacter butzleri]MCG3705951.1 chromate efflux transporter [Aliarcobacter butzleri]MCG3708814.1 chromate efflux transporter [Aliarcobacter butzleri]MCT7632427.1 chromate efflux transporter [Aliarcobacter butzleri]